MQRTLVIIGSLLLVAAALPGVTAHLTADNGSATSFGFGGPDNPEPCRYNAEDCGADDAHHEGVSGTYVLDPSSGSSYIGVGDPDQDGEDGITVVTLTDTVPEAPFWDQDGDGEWFPQDGVDTQDEVAPTLFPAGSISGAGALCDAEVIDASGLADEEVVDGDDEADGEQPDGTWDDGGFGGACHTPDTHYSNQDWNTAGCGEGTASSVSHAEDWTAGDYVFITASCNFQIEESAGNRAVILAIDLVNDFLGSPTDPVNVAGEMEQTTTEFVNDVATSECVQNGASGPFIGCAVNFMSGSGAITVRCTVDSAADDSINGFGGGDKAGSATLPGPSVPPGGDVAGDGVPYPGVTGQCANSVDNAQAVATTFVFHTTAFSEGVWDGGATIEPVGAYQSTGGWIDSTCLDDPDTTVDECA